VLENVAANIEYSCLSQHVRLHEVIQLSCSHVFLKISAWHLVVWHCGRSYTTKNRWPQPSTSYLLSVMTTFQRTEWIHFRIVRSDRGDVLNLMMCNMASSTSTDKLLYSIMRIPKMYATSSCPLPAVCSMCWSPFALNPVHKTLPTTKYGHQVNSSVKQRKT
jgi:hypothetical protein